MCDVYNQVYTLYSRVVICDVCVCLHMHVLYFILPEKHVRDPFGDGELPPTFRTLQFSLNHFHLHNMERTCKYPPYTLSILRV